MSKDLHKRLEEIIYATDAGSKLPSEPKLAGILGVSRATLREAMRTFETQGLLLRKQGIGTYVIHPTQIIESGLEVLASIEKLAEQIGLPVSMGNLEISNQVADNKVAEKLRLQTGSNLLRISRVILAENRPVAYLVDILPEEILSGTDINKGFTGSVLDLLLNRGDPVVKISRCEIGATAANHEIARALNVQRSTSLLFFESLLYAEDGSPVDYSQSYFLPGYFKFHIVRRVA